MDCFQAELRASAPADLDDIFRFARAWNARHARKDWVSVGTTFDETNHATISFPGHELDEDHEMMF